MTPGFEDRVTREPPRIGDEIAGYRLEVQLARGGMAVVYVAEHVALGRRVALKVLVLAPELAEDEAFRERFVRESRMAASIDHPNVIPIYDAGEADGLLYVAMRLVEETDLRQLLRRESRLDIDRSIAIATQIASALEPAHQRGLVHRDVKPANVLLIPRRSPDAVDHVYLSDFGLAKRTSSITGLTATGQFLGTVSYIAPEQAEGKTIDGRADIYALGCVLFECLTGRPPFQKEEDLAVVLAHLNESAPRVTELRPECPPDLADVLAKMLEKPRDARFSTCDELITALRAASRGRAGLPATRPSPVVGDGGTADSPAAEEHRWPLTRRRRRWAVGLLGVCAIGVGAFLLVGGGDDGGTEDGTSPAPPPQTRTGPAPSSGDWRALRGASTPRRQAPSAAAAGRIWTFGGLTGRAADSAAPTPSVEAYDTAIDTWTPGPELPGPLHHSMAVSYRGDPVVIGGWVPKGADLTAEESGRVFALRGDRWEELPSLNHPRAGAAAAVVGDEIVVVGGQADGELVTVTEVFDGERWREAAEIPTPREHLAAASDGRFLYALGGRDLTPDKNTGAFERYDPEADEWTRLPSMPTPSGSLGAAVVEGNVVTVGGEEPTRVLDAVQAYDLDTGRWARLPPLTTPRHGAFGGRDRGDGIRHRRRAGSGPRRIDRRRRGARFRIVRPGPGRLRDLDLRDPDRSGALGQVARELPEGGLLAFSLELPPQLVSAPGARSERGPVTERALEPPPRGERRPALARGVAVMEQEPHRTRTESVSRARPTSGQDPEIRP